MTTLNAKSAFFPVYRAAASEKSLYFLLKILNRTKTFCETVRTLPVTPDVVVGSAEPTLYRNE